MADIVDVATRSRMMSGIKGANTKPELAIRRSLHKAGFRFRLHARHLPGKPDLVLPKWRVVVFVHGCFWHRHPGCKFATIPATRADFWATKFAANVDRDQDALALLRMDGWRVATVWECAIRRDTGSVMRRLEEWIRSGSAEIVVE